jgi:hypothetical protein
LAAMSIESLRSGVSDRKKRRAQNYRFALESSFSTVDAPGAKCKLRGGRNLRAC